MIRENIEALSNEFLTEWWYEFSNLFIPLEESQLRWPIYLTILVTQLSSDGDNKCNNFEIGRGAVQQSQSPRPHFYPHFLLYSYAYEMFESQPSSIRSVITRGNKFVMTLSPSTRHSINPEPRLQFATFCQWIASTNMICKNQGNAIGNKTTKTRRWKLSNQKLKTIKILVSTTIFDFGVTQFTSIYTNVIYYNIS